MGLLCGPPKTFEIEEDGNPGIPREAVPSGVGDARGLEGAVWMSWVKVETVSIKCVILISNAACEFIIICCTVFSLSFVEV